MRANEVVTILEKEGFESIRQTGSHRIFRHAETGLQTTVPMHTGDVAPGTLRSIWRQSGLLDELAGVNSVREAMARLDARNAGPLPLTSDQQKVSDIVDSPKTESFWINNQGRAAYMYNEEQKTVLSVISDTKGRFVETRMRQFNSAEEAANFFGEMRSVVGRNAGTMPDIINDGMRGLSKAYQAIHGGMIPPAIRNAGDDVGRFLGKASKVLGVVGVAAASAEAAQLGMNARDLVEYGNLHPDAITEYDALLAGHITQATADATLLGGEVVTQAWFDEWATKWGLEAHEKAELEPGSLLEDIQAGVEMANAAIKDAAEAALRAAGHAADEITDRMLQNKMRDLTDQYYNEGLDLNRLLPVREIPTPGFELRDLIPDLRQFVPEIPMPDIIPDFQLPSIPSIFPKLTDAGSAVGTPATRLAHFNDQADPETAALRMATYHALPDEPHAIAKLPEAMQTMALVKDNAEMFASEFAIYTEENGTEGAEKLVSEAQIAQAVVSSDSRLAVADNIEISPASLSSTSQGMRA